MLHQLVYISYAKPIPTQLELLDLLQKSRSNNERLGITGLLLYNDGSIIQVLEGKKEVVHSLYAKICNDPRHGGIILLLDVNIADRGFPDWSMGFRPISDDSLAQFKGFLNLDEHAINAPANPKMSVAVTALINSFSNVSIKRYGRENPF